MDDELAGSTLSVILSTTGVEEEGFWLVLVGFSEDAPRGGFVFRIQTTQDTQETKREY